MTYPVLVDPGGQIAAAWGVASPPTTFIVDAKGDVVEALVGPLTAEPARRASGAVPARAPVARRSPLRWLDGRSSGPAPAVRPRRGLGRPELDAADRRGERGSARRPAQVPELPGALGGASSASASSLAVRRQVPAEIDAGRSDDEIVASLEAATATPCCLTPPPGGLTDLLWLLPVALGARRRRGRRRPWRSGAVLAEAQRRWLPSSTRQRLEAERSQLLASLADAAAEHDGGELDDASFARHRRARPRPPRRGRGRARRSRPEAPPSRASRSRPVSRARPRRPEDPPRDRALLARGATGWAWCLGLLVLVLAERSSIVAFGRSLAQRRPVACPARRGRRRRPAGQDR